MDLVEIAILFSALGGWIVACFAMIPLALNINLVKIGTKIWILRKMGKPINLGVHVTKDKRLFLSDVTVDKNNQIMFNVRGRALPYNVQGEGVFYCPTIGAQAMIAAEGRNIIYDPTKEIALVDPRTQEMIFIEAQYSEPSAIKNALAEVKRNSMVSMVLSGVVILGMGYVIIQVGAVQEGIAAVSAQASNLSQSAQTMVDAVAQIIQGGTP